MYAGSGRQATSAPASRRPSVSRTTSLVTDTEPRQRDRQFFAPSAASAHRRGTGPSYELRTSQQGRADDIPTDRATAARRATISGVRTTLQAPAGVTVRVATRGHHRTVGSAALHGSAVGKVSTGPGGFRMSMAALDSLDFTGAVARLALVDAVGASGSMHATVRTSARTLNLGERTAVSPRGAARPSSASVGAAPSSTATWPGAEAVGHPPLVSGGAGGSTGARVRPRSRALTEGYAAVGSPAIAIRRSSSARGGGGGGNGGNGVNGGGGCSRSGRSAWADVDGAQGGSSASAAARSRSARDAAAAGTADELSRLAPTTVGAPIYSSHAVAASTLASVYGAAPGGRRASSWALERSDRRARPATASAAAAAASSRVSAAAAAAAAAAGTSGADSSSASATDDGSSSGERRRAGSVARTLRVRITPMARGGSRARPEMRHAPLVIVHLHATIADLYPPSFWAQPPTHALFVRPGAAIGLRLLAQSHQLVGVCHCTAHYAPLALAHLQARGVRFDALYDVSELACAGGDAESVDAAAELADERERGGRGGGGGGGAAGGGTCCGGGARGSERSAAGALASTEMLACAAAFAEQTAEARTPFARGPSPAASLLRAAEVGSEGGRGEALRPHAYSSAAAAIARTAAPGHAAAEALPFSRAQQALVSSYNPKRGALPACDYSPIYDAFGVPPEEVCARVLVIGSIDLDHDEIEEREGTRLLCDDEQLAPRPAFTGASARPPCCPHGGAQHAPPVVLLVPNPRAQPDSRALRMELILDIVQDLYTSGRANWHAGFRALGRRDVKKARVHARPDGVGIAAEPGEGSASSTAHAYVVVRGARARAPMLVPFDPSRVLRPDELDEVAPAEVIASKAAPAGPDPPPASGPSSSRASAGLVADACTPAYRSEKSRAGSVGVGAASTVAAVAAR